MSDIKLTKLEAYLAMYTYLEAYYDRGKSDEIASMLSSMSILEDGSSADPAIKEDWDDAVESVIKGKVNAKLQLTK